MFQRTEHFNKEVIGINREQGYRLDEAEVKFFTGLLQEEIKEFVDAYEEKDLVKQIDALLDLIYFAGGGLVRLGIVSNKSEAMFQAVHEKNMMKKKGRKEERDIVGDTDAIKPEGWSSPEEAIAAILQQK